MMSLIDYEKDLLEARGRIEDERKKRNAEEEKQKERLKPHGVAAWKIYCEENGFDPNTHKIKSVDMSKHDINKVLQ